MAWDHVMVGFILSGGVRHTHAELMTLYGVDSLEEVRAHQERILAESPELDLLYRAIDQPVSDITARMHAHGVLIDIERLKHVQDRLTRDRAVCARRITDRLGEVNPNSPRQLGEALVSTLGVKLTRTATGQYGTRSEDLTELAPTYPVVQDILDFRSLDKCISGYIEPILARVDHEHRIHPTYDLTSAATGRIATSDPNIQSTPISKPYGDMIRDCFVAPKGGVLMGFDYSQQELKILAHLSGDVKLREAFEQGSDVHAITASRIFDVPLASVSPAQRAVGKTLNFGIIYGETPYGLSRQLKKPVEECAHILKTYFEIYSGVKRYFDNLLVSAKLHGYVETICGRRRGIPGHPFGKPARYLTPAQERVLKNFPIQGSAADMTKKAMVAIADHVLPRYPDAFMTMQIHDELIFEYHASDTSKVNAFAREVHDAMVKALPLDVPVAVDWMVGDTWKELK